MLENEEILSVEREVEHNIKIGEALKRLQDNDDFKTLILEGYLKEKALASVSLLSVPQIKESGKRPDVIEDLVASSNLSYFLTMVENAYMEATDPVYSDQEEEEHGQ